MTLSNLLNKEWQYQLFVISGGYLSGLVGGDLSKLTTQLRTQYPNAWIPPNYIFPIVWIFLYFFYGSSLYKFFYELPEEKQVKIDKLNQIQKLLLLGLFLNYLWTPLFFNSRRLSFFVIIAQITTVILSIYFILQNESFEEKSKLVTYQIIYLSWLTFACILNYQVL